MSLQKSSQAMWAGPIWGGKYVRCRWSGRTLCTGLGPVSTAVPIVVRYRGSQKKALKLVDRLRRCGYRATRQKTSGTLDTPPRFSQATGDLSRA